MTRKAFTAAVATLHQLNREGKLSDPGFIEAVTILAETVSWNA